MELSVQYCLVIVTGPRVEEPVLVSRLELPCFPDLDPEPEQECLPPPDQPAECSERCTVEIWMFTARLCVSVHNLWNSRCHIPAIAAHIVDCKSLVWCSLWRILQSIMHSAIGSNKSGLSNMRFLLPVSPTKLWNQFSPKHSHYSYHNSTKTPLPSRWPENQNFSKNGRVCQTVSDLFVRYLLYSQHIPMLEPIASLCLSLLSVNKGAFFFVSVSVGESDSVTSNCSCDCAAAGASNSELNLENIVESDLISPLEPSQSPGQQPGLFAVIYIRRVKNRYQRLLILTCRGETEDSEDNDTPKLSIPLDPTGNCYLYLDSDDLFDAVTGNPVHQQHFLILQPGYEVTIETDLDYIPGQFRGEITLKLSSQRDIKTLNLPVLDTWIPSNIKMIRPLSKIQPWPKTSLKNAADWLCQTLSFLQLYTNTYAWKPNK